jgi:hypothetical protein
MNRHAAAKRRLMTFILVPLLFMNHAVWAGENGTVGSDAAPAGALFSAGPDMNTARMGHLNVSFVDGSAVVFGGHGTGFKPLDSAEMWNPTTNTFSSLKMNFTHDGAAFARIADGRFLLAGGAADSGGAPGFNTAEIYDPMDHSFTTTGKMKYPRMDCAAATLAGGKTLVVGGGRDDLKSTKFGELFDPTTETFTTTNALNTPRTLPLVLPATDGRAVLLGGFTTSGAALIERVEVYGPGNNSFSVKRESLFASETSWVTRGPYARPVENHQMSDGRYLYLAYRSNGSEWDYSLFTFDPDTKDISRFETTPALPNSGQVSFDQPLVDVSRNRAYLLGTVTS